MRFSCIPMDVCRCIYIKISSEISHRKLVSTTGVLDHVGKLLKMVTLECNEDILIHLLDRRYGVFHGKLVSTTGVLDHVRKLLKTVTLECSEDILVHLLDRRYGVGMQDF
jgi:hypothetical protein